MNRIDSTYPDFIEAKSLMSLLWVFEIAESDDDEFINGIRLLYDQGQVLLDCEWHPNDQNNEYGELIIRYECTIFNSNSFMWHVSRCINTTVKIGCNDFSTTSLYVFNISKRKAETVQHMISDGILPADEFFRYNETGNELGVGLMIYMSNHIKAILHLLRSDIELPDLFSEMIDGTVLDMYYNEDGKYMILEVYGMWEQRCGRIAQLFTGGKLKPKLGGEL